MDRAEQIKAELKILALAGLDVCRNGEPTEATVAMAMVMSQRAVALMRELQELEDYDKDWKRLADKGDAICEEVSSTLNQMHGEDDDDADY